MSAGRYRVRALHGKKGQEGKGEIRVGRKTRAEVDTVRVFLAFIFFVFIYDFERERGRGREIGRERDGDGNGWR